jgi:hypothetical protein
MVFEVIQTEQDLPPETSGKGANTYYIACSAVGFSSNYAVCQHVIAKHKTGKLPGSYTGCGQAIDCGNCDAVKMQKMEQEAGKALFYRERQKFVEEVEKEREAKIDYNSESYKRGRYGVKVGSRFVLPENVPEHKKPVPKKESAPVEFNSAQVLNEAVAEDKEKPVRQKGETPAEFLKRIRGV